MADVYHATKDHAVFPTDFALVASVNTGDLETVFTLTNHIDAPWWTNPRVTKRVAGSVRSTSVGDMVVTADGVFRCAPTGWEKTLWCDRGPNGFFLHVSGSE